MQWLASWAVYMCHCNTTVDSPAGQIIPGTKQEEWLGKIYCSTYQKICKLNHQYPLQMEQKYSLIWSYCLLECNSMRFDRNLLMFQGNVLPLLQGRRASQTENSWSLHCLTYSYNLNKEAAYSSKIGKLPPNHTLSPPVWEPQISHYLLSSQALELLKSAKCMHGQNTHTLLHYYWNNAILPGVYSNLFLYFN
jgi:hypothetical protein